MAGIKEKILAAHRAGLRNVLLASRNRKDLEDVPEEIRDAIEFHFVEHALDAIREAVPGCV